MTEVFSFGGEGGSITIYKAQENNTEVFVYYYQELDPDDEEEERTITKKATSATFEEAFALINKYPWHKLIITVLNEDYRYYVIAQLIDRLNKENLTPENLRNRERLEKRLSIKLSYSFSEGNSSPNWSYEITNPDMFRNGFYF
jgi:DNA-directed RNA polymerase beta' subunit